jgi:hypothetical protein
VDEVRIVYLIAAEGITGGNGRIYTQINKLIERGHNVEVISLFPQPRWFPLKVKVDTIPRSFNSVRI